VSRFAYNISSRICPPLWQQTAMVVGSPFGVIRVDSAMHPGSPVHPPVNGHVSALVETPAPP
jgi:hypothetical protein